MKHLKEIFNINEDSSTSWVKASDKAWVQSDGAQLISKLFEKLDGTKNSFCINPKYNDKKPESIPMSLPKGQTGYANPEKWCGPSYYDDCFDNCFILSTNQHYIYFNPGGFMFKPRNTMTVYGDFYKWDVLDDRNFDNKMIHEFIYLKDESYREDADDER